jgi:hypothetical protein
MILHTIVPQDLIFKNSEADQELEEQMVLYDGVQVTAQLINGGQMRINKILSTDPSHYLRSDIYPGAVLKMW